MQHEHDHQADVAALAAEVTRLRRLVKTLIVGVMAAVAVGAKVQSSGDLPWQKVLRAQRIELSDADGGRAVVQITAEGGEGVMNLFSTASSSVEVLVSAYSEDEENPGGEFSLFSDRHCLSMQDGKVVGQIEESPSWQLGRLDSEDGTWIPALLLMGDGGERHATLTVDGEASRLSLFGGGEAEEVVLESPSGE